MYKKNFYIAVVALLTYCFISGCSDYEGADESTMHSEEYDDDIFIEEASELYRPGVVSIDVLIKQSGVIDEPEDDSGSSMSGSASFELNAHFKREGLVSIDLSDPFIGVLPEDYVNDKYFKPTAFSDGPYTFSDHNYKQFPEAEITGSIISHLDYVIHSPNSVDSVKTTVVSNEKGDVSDIEFDNMKLSKIGLGYTFNLKIYKHSEYTTHQSLTYRNGYVNKISDSKSKLEPIDFVIQPHPNKKALDRIIYTPMEIKHNEKKRDIEFFGLLSNQFDSEAFPFVKFCMHTKEIATKDSLTVTCNYSGNNWISMDGMVGSPDTTILITLTIAAKK